MTAREPETEAGRARRAEHLRRDGETTFAAGRRLGEAELRRSLAEKVRALKDSEITAEVNAQGAAGYAISRDDARRRLVLALIEGSDPASPEPPSRQWVAHGLAALDDLSHEWHNAEGGGMSVGEFRARIDAIRAAFEASPAPATEPREAGIARIEAALRSVDATEKAYSPFLAPYGIEHNAPLLYAAGLRATEPRSLSEPLDVSVAPRGLTDLIGWFRVCHEFARTIRRWQHQPGVKFGNEAEHIENAAAKGLLALGAQISGPVKVRPSSSFATDPSAPEDSNANPD